MFKKVLVFVLIIKVFALGTPEVVLDPNKFVNPQTTVGDKGAILNNKLIYAKKVESVGTELFSLDLTTGTSNLIKDIIPGTGSSSPTEFALLGSRVVFSAYDSAAGNELYVTDGSPEGTVLFADINPGASSSNPSGLFSTSVGIVYFVANDASGGRELWRTDGENVSLVADLEIGAGSSNPISFSESGGVFYFLAEKLTTGYEAYSITLSTPGTINFLGEPEVGAITSNPSNMIKGSSHTVFQAKSSANGQELWTSSSGVVSLLSDINSGSSSSTPVGPVWTGTQFLFVAFNGSNYCVYSSTGVAGNATCLVPLASNISVDQNFGAYSVGTKILFSATTNGADKELWISDGTVLGTLNLDIASGAASSEPQFISKFPNLVIFTAATASRGRELFVTDGTKSGSVQLIDLNSGSLSSNPSLIAKKTDQIIVQGSVDGNSVNSSFVSSKGTVATTSKVGTIFQSFGSAASAQFSKFQATGNKLVFVADDGHRGKELWIASTNSSDAVFRSDLEAGPVSSNPQDVFSNNNFALYNVTKNTTGNLLCSLIDGNLQIFNDTKISDLYNYFIKIGELNGKTYYVSDSDDFGTEIFSTDGTVIGTSLAFDLFSGTTSGASSFGGTVLGNKIIFTGKTNNSLGFELYISDGTLAGTSLLKDINPGADSSSPTAFKVVGNKVIFKAYTPATGTELWVTDGTTSGTSLISDLNVGAGSISYSLSEVVGNSFYFVTELNGLGSELWKTDGTFAGTSIVKDINLSGSSSPDNLKAYSNKLYFAANDGENGKELWVSDGSEAGTLMLNNINPGSSSSSPSSLEVSAGLLFFVAQEPVNGKELWFTDGNATTTQIASNIKPDSSSSNPANLKNVQGTLFFSATRDSSEGDVLFKLALDQDNDGVRDENDLCILDPNKSAPGVCGCGVSDADSNGNSKPDCLDPSASTKPARAIVTQNAKTKVTTIKMQKFTGGKYTINIKPVKKNAFKNQKIITTSSNYIKKLKVRGNARISYSVKIGTVTTQESIAKIIKLK